MSTTADRKSQNINLRESRHVLRRMLRFGIPYRWHLLLALVLLIGSIATELAQPYLVKVAIDSYIDVPDPDVQGLVRLMLIYLVVVVAAFGLNYGQALILRDTGRKIVYDLRMAVFKHLQTLSQQFFDRTAVGRIVTRVAHDTESINQLFTDLLVHSARDILMILGIVVVMLQLNVTLALVSLAVVPLIVAVSYFFKNRLRDAYRTSRGHLSHLNGFLAENLAGILTVQLFNREAKQATEFNRISEDYRKANIREVRLSSGFSHTLRFLTQFAVAFLLWYGGGEVIQGTVTFGVVYAFLTYVRQLFQPIQDLTGQLNVLQSALTSSERLVEVLNQEPQVVDPETPVPLHEVRGEIRFENVWFAYNDEEWVLKDINFTIEPGQTVAFVGATGAGKSSVINLIGRFYDVQRGRITLDGVDIRDVTQADLRRHIAVVQQEVFLFAGDIASNVRLGNKDITDAQIIQALEAVGLGEYVKALPRGIRTTLYEGGKTLSAGHRQLISFARAICFNPSILILDEATSNIDTETESLVQRALAKASEGRTTLIIAHRLSTIQHADMIIVLDKGRIVEAGDHASLLAQGGIYRQLYELSWAQEGA